jgi:hypothetical protein
MTPRTIARTVRDIDNEHQAHQDTNWTRESLLDLYGEIISMIADGTIGLDSVVECCCEARQGNDILEG